MSAIKNTDKLILRSELSKQLYARIKDSPPHTIFFISDFMLLGGENEIQKALNRLTQKGVLEKVAPGIFCKPKISKFGNIPIPLNLVAEAIAKRDRVSILPSGETALNQLGLSTQVPMKAVFLTSGSARTLKVGNRSIAFMRGVPKNFAYQTSLMPLLVQALKALGRENIDEETQEALRRIIETHSETDLRQDLTLAPQWIQKLVKPLLYEQMATA